MSTKTENPVPFDFSLCPSGGWFRLLPRDGQTEADIVKAVEWLRCTYDVARLDVLRR